MEQIRVHGAMVTEGVIKNEEVEEEEVDLTNLGVKGPHPGVQEEAANGMKAQCLGLTCRLMIPMVVLVVMPAVVVEEEVVLTREGVVEEEEGANKTEVEAEVEGPAVAEEEEHQV